jgi:hypothetical protein
VAALDHAPVELHGAVDRLGRDRHPVEHLPPMRSAARDLVQVAHEVSSLGVQRVTLEAFIPYVAYGAGPVQAVPMGRRPMRMLMCALVALMWTGVAQAGDISFMFMTGNQLLAYCKDPRGSETRAACVACVEASLIHWALPHWLECSRRTSSASPQVSRRDKLRTWS